MTRIRLARYTFSLGLLLLSSSASVDTRITELNFDVYLNGKLMGWHKFVLKSENGGWEVESDTNLDGRLFLFKRVSYRHTAIERWTNGCLQSIWSETERQKVKTIVQGDLTTQGFKLNKNGVEELLPECTRTFSYWAPDLLETDFLLDPDTANYIPISYQKVPRDKGFSVILQTPKAQISLEYDQDGGWQTLESLVKSIVPIKYERAEREKSH